MLTDLPPCHASPFLFTAKYLHTRYLICLWHIYNTLESSLDQLATHPVLATTYNPALLARAAKLEDDIRFFLGLNPGQDWKEHTEADLQQWPQETRDALDLYVDRLKSLAAGQRLHHHTSADSVQDWAYAPSQPAPELLLSHAYVRYMGDMSGGQDIRKSIAAAYSLPLDLPDGQRFYEFGEKGFDIKEIKQIKRDFRVGLDQAGQHLPEPLYRAQAFYSSIPSAMKLTPPARIAADDVLQEANHAFELNIRLFSSFASELPADFSYNPPASHSHATSATSSHAPAAGGQCPFKHLQFAGNVGHSAARHGLQQVASLPKALQSVLAAFIALLLALCAHQWRSTAA